MDFIEKNRKTLFIATGIAGAMALGVGIWALIKNNTAHAEVHNHADGFEKSAQVSKSRVFIKDKRYLEMVEKLRKALRTEKKGQLSKQFLISVDQAILELFKNDFLKAFTQIRDARRQYIENLPKYAEEYFQGSFETEKILEDASTEVFKDLELDAAFFEDQCERVSQMDQNFPMFMLYMLESLKSQIPSKMNRQLTHQDLIEGFTYQINLLDQIDFSQFGDLTDENMLLCKQGYISDLTSMKFGFEEEDIACNPGLLSTHPKIPELHNQLQSRLYRQD
jgi:hypothetical protein